MSSLNNLSNRLIQPSQLRENWSATISDHVIDLAWSPDGKYIAAASVLGPVTIFEGDRQVVIHNFEGHEFGTMSIAWRPDSKVLASAGQDGKIRLWDLTSGEATHLLDGGAAWVEHLAWSDGKNPILASAAGRKLKLWNADGDLVREYPDHQSTISGLQWKPRVRQLGSIAYGGVSLWDPQQSDVVRRLEWRGSSLVIAWSPDGRHIATGDQDSTVHSGLCLPVRTCKCLAIRRKCENSRGMPRVDTWLQEVVRKLRCGIVPVADRRVPNRLHFPGIRIFSALCVFNITENCWPQAVPTVWSTSGN